MPIKILSHFAHTTYQTELSKIPGVEFYHLDSYNSWAMLKEKLKNFIDIDNYPNFKLKHSWDDSPRPSNIYDIKDREQLLHDMDIIQVHWHPYIEPLGMLAKILKIPIIMIEHTWPKTEQDVFYWKNIRREYCDYTVFITPSSKDAWGYTDDPQASYIYHSIDIENFPQKVDYSGSQIMTTTNEFISRDWACGFSLWANVLGIPMKPYFDNIALYGYSNKNIGKVSKGPRTREEILDLLYNAGLYFNPSIMSPIPMSLLEAVAVGTPIVSTTYCEPGTIFKNKEHGIMSNDIVELRDGIKYLLNNSEDAKRMANNAREVIRKLFNPQQFRRKWMDLFNRITHGV